MKKYKITRSQRKLWLCQNSYSNKIASAFYLTDFRPIYTPLHGAALNRAIAYLYQTRTLAIKYSSRNIGSQIVVRVSDAAFGNDLISRKSTEGFIFLLFRGAINWRSTNCLAYLHHLLFSLIPCQDS
jgi:hypothetical protein